jgi:uncharacterized membrane protein YbhN (UPF0104 family)
VQTHLRTLVVLALVVGLLGVFLHNVDLRRVAADIFRARPYWLALSVTTMFVNLAIRALRWQYLLEPLGETSFGNAFRATAVGFAASSVLPARAGEVIRPYFLARHEQMSATGAFATIILERLLDLITVLMLLAAFVFVFGRNVATGSPNLFEAVKWAGGFASAVSLVALVLLFVLAGSPERLASAMRRFEHAAPGAFAGLISRMVQKFARGLGTIRRPARLLVALVVSALAVDRPGDLGDRRGVWLQRAVHGHVSDRAAADARRAGADARRDRRLSRSVPARRHAVLRRAGCRRRRGRAGAARVFGRALPVPRAVLRREGRIEHRRSA